MGSNLRIVKGMIVESENIFLGSRLRQLRGKSSQAEFAVLMDVSVASVSRYEKGTTPIPSDVLHRLCALAGVNADWLLFGTEPVERQRAAGEDGIPAEISAPLPAAGRGSVDMSSKTGEIPATMRAPPATVAGGALNYAGIVRDADRRRMTPAWVKGADQVEIPILADVPAGQWEERTDGGRPAGGGVGGDV